MAFDYRESWMNVTKGFECPLSIEIMVDPVMVTDEDPNTKIKTTRNYERVTIKTYFEDRERKQLPYIDPCTMNPCSNILIPNVELQNKIAIFSQANEEFERGEYSTWQEGVIICEIPSFETIRKQVGDARNLILYGNTWIYLDDTQKRVINLENKTSEITFTFWLSFVAFLSENRKILLGVLLGTALLIGLGALAVGTCGLSLPVTAASVLVTAIGIKGIIAFLSVGAAVTGVSTLVGGGWIGHSIFSRCTKTPEEPEMPQAAPEIG